MLNTSSTLMMIMYDLATLPTPKTWGHSSSIVHIHIIWSLLVDSFPSRFPHRLLQMKVGDFSLRSQTVKGLSRVSHIILTKRYACTPGR
ncbi:hypothetical protein AZE42_12022 [Rhizopogon vesiculosus]|uniref:Uncharacterized protein n=1 Tax=Rhizopogon vesiculosus TaxID=180088 RepID=A0A1J8QME0_9AGAM|nr:hypothetical protein AZE42_12022 [Rhizopogon vesiculosus]